MRIGRRTSRFTRASAFWLVCGASALFAEPQSVAVTVEPPQEIRGIVLRHGDEVRAVVVERGRFTVPGDFPLPWTVGLTRFAPTVYTPADLAARRPLRLQALGTVTGRLADGKRACASPVLLLYDRKNEAIERPLDLAANGSFSTHVVAGYYDAALVSPTGASRVIRSVVVPPGSSVSLGDVVCGAGTRVQFTVTDAKHGTAVPNARIRWSPAAELNSESAAGLFARAWSSVTNARGLAELRGFGPMPISGRWRIEAEGYASHLTGGVVSSSADAPIAIAAPLRRVANLRVRLVLPPELRSLRRARLVLGRRDPRSGRFTSSETKALTGVEVGFVVSDYGHKRLWIEQDDGRRIWYRDFEVRNEVETIVVEPFSVEVIGKATRNREPVASADIRVSDARDHRFTLGSSKTDATGHYRFSYYDSGSVVIHALTRYAPGSDGGSMSRRVDPRGAPLLEENFEFGEEAVSIRVVDAVTDKPVVADVERTLELRDGRRSMMRVETNAEGLLTISGFGPGMAHLRVSAAGYAAQTVDLELRRDAATQEIRLERVEPVRGRLVDAHGRSVGGAII